MVPAYLRAGDVAWFDLDAGGTKERTRPCNPKKELSMRTRTSCCLLYTSGDRQSRRWEVHSRRSVSYTHLKVVKTNDPLRDQPELLNEDCYDEGWMVELELSSLDELKQMMTSEEYAKYVKEHS